METIARFERKLLEWYKNTPHLSEKTRRSLAVNIWWIVLTGAILGGAALLVIIAGAFFAGAALSIFGGILGTAIGGLVLLGVLAYVGFAGVTLTLASMSIAPLKAMRRRGWLLLFVALLIQFLENIVSFVFSWNILGLIWNLFITALAGYLLFEIRSLFDPPAYMKRDHKESLDANIKS